MLQWLLGPLSDKYGRRPVMLGGILFFILACVLTTWVGSIKEFVALRFIQGISLCFIGTVSYAAVQEAFDDALAVRVMALMANVALLAPLATAATQLHCRSWRATIAIWCATGW